MVFMDQPKQEKPPEQQPVQLDVPLKGFQTVVAPDVIPTNIPPVNLQEHFDPKDYSGTGVEGGVATGMVPTGNEVFMEAIVEGKPAVLSGPQLQFPELLRQAQIQGRVRSEEHTSELQSPCNLVCRLLLEKKKNNVVASVDVKDDYDLAGVARRWLTCS